MAQVIGKSRDYLRNQSTFADLKLFLVIVVLVSLAYVLQAILGNASGVVLIVMISGFLLVFLSLKAVADSASSSSDKFMSGHRGENIAEDILKRLPEQYVVFRDVIIGQRGNIDFVVVGPNGVFVVEVKHHVGRIAFDGTRLTRNGRPIREKDLLKQAMRQSFQIREYLERQAGVRTFVTAILLFTNSRATLSVGTAPLKSVHVVGPRFVGQVITNRTGGYGPQHMEAIIAALRQTVRE